MPFKPQRFSLTEAPFFEVPSPKVKRLRCWRRTNACRLRIYSERDWHWFGLQNYNFFPLGRWKNDLQGLKKKATGDNGEVSTASVSTQANPTFSRDGLGAVAQFQLIRFDLVTVFRQSTKTAFPSSVMDFTCECPTIWMTLVLLKMLQ